MPTFAAYIAVIAIVVLAGCGAWVTLTLPILPIDEGDDR